MGFNRDMYWQKLADRLGVSSEKLDEARKQAWQDTLDQAVKDGEVSNEQAAHINEWRQAREQGGRGEWQGGPGFGPGRGFGPGGPGFGRGFGPGPGWRGPFAGPRGGGGRPWGGPPFGPRFGFRGPFGPFGGRGGGGRWGDPRFGGPFDPSEHHGPHGHHGHQGHDDQPEQETKTKLG